MNLEAIATYLSSKGCGQPGKTIFVTEMPTACQDGILLMDSYSGTPIDHYLPGYYSTEFRLVVRGIVYETAHALSKKASAALKASGGFTAGTLLVSQCLPMNLPRPYRRSAGAYWEFEVDIGITFVDTTP